MAKKRSSRPATRFIDDPLWYKDAVIYQVHVKSYFDANDDGIGDFAGLIAKLDYIADLGVNTIWVLPFYPSPRRDDGYDIAEYCDVSRDYGTRADAKRFISEAHRRGLRVISELVINHTSDQHPWFQRARNAKPGSSARNFYVWSDSDDKFPETRIIFIDTEKSNWTWDPVAKQYFWHRFYSHQPDLNFDNPRVLEALLRVMRYWLDLGVDGLRLDAIPYLVEREGTNNENLDETHQVLKRIRAVIDQHYPDRMLLAEANQWPEDTRPYFGGNDEGEGDECHMAFHFPLMPRMYMALAQEDRFPISDILRQTPEIPANCQWAIFLRNHDELTLEMVTDRERDYLWNFYAADRRARLNLGIRRRLAPLMERDRRRIELLNSMLLSMPGTPVVYYGDEIGMGDNIYLGDRDGVRTPMQWTVDRNGGFSRADPAQLVLPPIMDPLYGYQTINVEAQQRDPHSLLNWTRRLLAVRKQQKAFGRGSMNLLSPSNRRILAYLREYTGPDGKQETVLCVANVSRVAQAAELELSAYSGMVPVEMIGGSAFPPIGQLSYLLTLQPYGFYWFLLADQTQMPSWHQEPVESMPELHTLVVKRSADELLEGKSRETLERIALPTYLPKRRWYAAKSGHIDKVEFAYGVRFGEGRKTAMLGEIEVTCDGKPERYQLPLGFLPEEALSSALPQQLALARVRRGREVGLLTDAFTLDHFVHAILKSMRKQLTLPCTGGELRFSATAPLRELELSADAAVRILSAEQSNTSAVVDDQLVLKLIRHVVRGVHPELEMVGFLTRQGFAHIAPLYGDLRRVDEDGEEHLLMLAQGFLHNQGDAWEWTQNGLERAIRDEIAGGVPEMESGTEALAALEAFIGLFGRRLGEMHALLATGEEPDFRLEITSAADAEGWAKSISAELEHVLALLNRQRATFDPALGVQIELLQQAREQLLARIARLAERAVGGARIRIHGDLHLGQVLVVQDDAYLIDFEGEPARPLDQRRAKTSPLKDVAGALRSFDYAAAMAQRNVQSSDSSEETGKIRERIAAAYRLRARELFLSHYRAAAELPHRWQEEGDEQATLELFILEKTVYEVAYEAENRPAWLAVPLSGLVELVQSFADEEPRS